MSFVLLRALILASIPATSAPQDAPAPGNQLGVLAISHAPPGCLVAGRFPTLAVRLDPAQEVVRARLRFRQVGTLYWYSVPLRRQGDLFSAMLPKPRRAPGRIEYCAEATTRSGASSGTPLFVVEVVDGDVCATTGSPAQTARGPLDALNRPAGAPDAPPGFVAATAKATAVVTDSAQSCVSEPGRPPPAPVSRPVERPAGRPGLLGAGDRIRITTGDGRWTGRLVSTDDDTITLGLAGGRTQRSVQRHTIRKLELSTGRGSRLVRAGMGAFLFAGLGALAGFVTEPEFAPGLILLGAPIGAVLGGVTAPEESWHTVDWERGDPSLGRLPSRPAKRLVWIRFSF